MVNDGMDGFTGLMEFITGILDLGDEVINRSFRGAAWPASDIWLS